MKELSKKNSCIIWAIVSIIIGIVYEIVCKQLGVYANFAIDRIFVVTSILLFIGAHRIFGFRKFYDFIIEKRYIIALICLILFTILNFDGISSFVWNFKLMALILVTFEFFQIITNKNKYMSLIGSILISCSSFMVWWFAADLIIFGELAILAIENFMKTEKNTLKIGWSIVLAYSVISYVFANYSAWIISFGYVFIAIAVWVVLKNSKQYKFRKIDFFSILLSIILIIMFLTGFFGLIEDAVKTIFNTSYLEEKNVSGGNGIEYLFSYAYSFMLPFVNTENNRLYASMLSLFPIPLIMGMIYIYKNEKHVSFILPMLIVLVLESIWCMSGFPEFLGKITLFNMVPVERCAIAVGLGCIYLYMYMISNIEENFISLKTTIKIALAIMVLFFFVNKPHVFQDSKGDMYLFSAILTLAYFLILNSLDKKYTKLFLGLMVIWTLSSSIFVNPITIDESKNIENNKVDGIYIYEIVN